MRASGLAIITALAVAGCGPDIVDLTTDGGVGGEPTHVVIGSDHPRNLDPAVDPAAFAELVAARNRFAFELYQELRGLPDNFVFSPVSLATAAARFHAGARRDTELELAGALQFPALQGSLHDGLNYLDLTLTSARATYEYRSTQALWGQVGVPYLVDYLDLLAEKYGADLHLVDFLGQPEEAAGVINQWMAGETDGAIAELLGAGEIASLPTLAVSDALTVAANWRDEFPVELTEEAPFQLAGGGTVTVEMMVSQWYDKYRYASGPGYQAMELSCFGEELAVILVLPDAGELEAVEDSLDGDWVAALVAALAPTELSLALPRFTVESRLRLDQLLSGLGVTEAFTASADFSGITGNLDLRLGALVHHTRVEVDERGINAVTGTLGISDAIVDRVVFDRPFLFLVRDSTTGAILFTGRVSNPAA